MNSFGGSWTEQKILLVENYAKAYLTIMNKYPLFKLMYFDGFAGNGEIKVQQKNNSKLFLEYEQEEIRTIQGAAKRIVAIKEPKPFDMYYFVELEKKKAEALKTALEIETTSEIYIVSEDCNVKLKDLATFLKNKKNRFYKVLAFIDPCGMNVEWSSIEQLKGLSVDLWILVPTGLGANRLLKKDKNIPKDWAKRLESFFGIPSDQLFATFYSEVQTLTLFGEDITTTKKKARSVEKINSVYVEKMKTVFSFISNPYVMKNSANSTMFHFFLASNNEKAVKIANDMIKKISN